MDREELKQELKKAVQWLRGNNLENVLVTIACSCPSDFTLRESCSDDCSICWAESLKEL